jgi:purine-binding chemotaxis protein CheW
MKSDTTKLVTFRLGQDVFAAEVTSVERVLRYTAPSSVPDVPRWIAGVLEHHSGVMPVVDLRQRVELPDLAVTAETRILVLGTTAGPVGAVVDAVLAVTSVPTTSISAPPPLFRGLAAEFVRGIAKLGDRLAVILDVDRVLSSADRIVLEQALQGAAARG